LQLFQSKSEARRMIENRGVKMNGTTVEDPKGQCILTEGLIVQVGKRKFIKITL